MLLPKIQSGGVQNEIFGISEEGCLLAAFKKWGSFWSVMSSPVDGCVHSTTNG